MLLPYIRPIIRKAIISKFMLLSGYQLSGFEAVEVGIISSAPIKKVRLSFIWLDPGIAAFSHLIFSFGVHLQNRLCSIIYVRSASLFQNFFIIVYKSLHVQVVNYRNIVELYTVYLIKLLICSWGSAVDGHVR